MSEPPNIWRHAPFRRWLLSSTISSTGSAVTAVVLPILAFQSTGSATHTSLLTAVRVVPYLFLGLIAGPVADRGNRRRLIVVGNVAQGLSIALIPLWAVVGEPPLWAIYAATLGAGIAFVYSDAAMFGAMASVIGRAFLPRAQGIIGTAQSLTEVLGPSLGAVLVAALGAAPAIWIDAASFAVTAWLFGTLRAPFRETPMVATDPAPNTQIDDIRSPSARAAFDFLRHHPELRILVPTGFLTSFATGAVMGLLVVYSVRRLGIDEDTWRIGIPFASSGVGAAVAGLFVARVYAPSRLRNVVPGACAVGAIMMLIVAFTTNLLVAIPALVILGLSWTIIFTLGIIHRMLETPDQLRASVNVLGRMVSWGGQPFGALAAGLVASQFTVQHAYVMAAAVLATSGALNRLLLPHRELLAAKA